FSQQPRRWISLQENRDKLKVIKTLKTALGLRESFVYLNCSVVGPKKKHFPGEQGVLFADINGFSHWSGFLPESKLDLFSFDGEPPWNIDPKQVICKQWTSFSL
ncbi:hypothetical protein SRHO_G00216060, partial [Serrasalmus rhombeus]